MPVKGPRLRRPDGQWGIAGQSGIREAICPGLVHFRAEHAIGPGFSRVRGPSG